MGSSCVTGGDETTLPACPAPATPPPQNVVLETFTRPQGPPQVNAVPASSPMPTVTPFLTPGRVVSKRFGTATARAASASRETFDLRCGLRSDSDATNVDPLGITSAAGTAVSLEETCL